MSRAHNEAKLLFLQYVPILTDFHPKVMQKVAMDSKITTLKNVVILMRGV
jgi:hypothetical protein